MTDEKMLDAAIKICAEQEHIKAEWVLAACWQMSGLRLNADVLSNQHKENVETISKISGYAPAKVNEVLKMFGNPYCIFDPELWQWADRVDLKLEKPSQVIMLGCRIGVGQRRADEIILSNAYIANKPWTWLEYINEFQIAEQLDIEMRHLARLYHPQLKGLQELFNFYISERKGISGRAVSGHPCVKEMLYMNQTFKKEISEYWRKVQTRVAI